MKQKVVDKLESIHRITKTNWFYRIQIAAIVFCAGELLLSDAFYMPYLIIAILSVYCVLANAHNKDRWEQANLIITIGFSLLFALMVVFSNYHIWAKGGFREALLFPALLISSFIAAYNILCFLAKKRVRLEGTNLYRTKPKTVFLIVFIIIVAVNSSILFLCKYPGFLSPDSLYQLRQLLTGTYTNHHPVYHTLVIKLMVSIGMSLFHNINAAVACYMVFQICFMAMAFGLSIMTMYENQAPIWSIVIVGVFYTIMPYHIMYSMTMWKDVVFGGAALFYTLFLYRSFKDMGSGVLNTIGLIISGIEFCLWRSNGLFAFVGATFVFAVLFRFKYKRMVVTMIVVIVGCFILKHPVLKSAGIPQPDLAESLSIPLQQVARDIIENDDFTKKESRLIRKVVDTKRVPEVYKGYLSDPIKVLVREGGNQVVLSENKTKYLEFYLSRATKHPKTYLKAWIDQTKGYWNSGYSYWIWVNGIDENEMNVTNTIRSDRINYFMNRYLSLYPEMPVLHLFISIGLFVWMLIALLYRAIIKRSKELVFLSIPSLMIIITLLIATPVFSEFRYAYAVFCTIPFLAIIVLTHGNRIEE